MRATTRVLLVSTISMPSVVRSVTGSRPGTLMRSPRPLGPSTTSRALAGAIELHRLAGKRDVRGHLHGLHERFRLAAGAHLPVHGADFVRVRGNDGGGFHEVVDDVGCLYRSGGEVIADVDDGELRAVVIVHDAILVRGDSGIARKINHQPVAELPDVPRREPHVSPDARVLHGLAEVAADV